MVTTLGEVLCAPLIGHTWSIIQTLLATLLAILRSLVRFVAIKPFGGLGHKENDLKLTCNKTKFKEMFSPC